MALELLSLFKAHSKILQNVAKYCSILIFFGIARMSITAFLRFMKGCT